MKTEALKQALRPSIRRRLRRRPAGRRVIRAKERIFSFRTAAQEWDPKNQRPEFWQLYNSRVKAGESVRVFPCRTGPSSTSGPTSSRKTSRSCPSTSRQDHDVVERDGSLIVVHDDRMRLARGGADPQRLSLPLARLLPADGGDASPREPRSPRSSPRCGGAHLRARRPADRPGRGQLDGEEEAGGLLLMPPRPAPLHHLRERGRRQVDPDRPLAARHAAHPGRPGRHARRATAAGTARRARSSTWPCWSTGCRPSASRASPSMSPTGSSPRPAPLHRRGHAGPRAVHPQHGHRRLDGRLAVLLVDARKGC